MATCSECSPTAALRQLDDGRLAGIWWTLLTLFVVCIWSCSHLVTFYTLAFFGGMCKTSVLLAACFKMEQYKNGAKTDSRGEHLKMSLDPLSCKKNGVSSNFGNVHYDRSQLRSCRPYVSIEEHTVEVEEHIGTTVVHVLFSLVV